MKIVPTRTMRLAGLLAEAGRSVNVPEDAARLALRHGAGPPKRLQRQPRPQTSRSPQTSQHSKAKPCSPKTSAHS